MLVASEDADDQDHLEAVRLLGDEDPLATLDLAYYEVTNVTAADGAGAQLVSGDRRDPTSRGLAVLPDDAGAARVGPWRSSTAGSSSS